MNKIEVKTIFEVKDIDNEIMKVDDIEPLDLENFQEDTYVILNTKAIYLNDIEFYRSHGVSLLFAPL